MGTRIVRSSVFLRIALSAGAAGLIAVVAHAINFNEPYLPFAIAGSLAFWLRSAPSRYEIYAGAVIAILFATIIHMPVVPFWVLRVAMILALPGFSALLMLMLRAIWSERDERQRALILLVPAITLAVYMMAAAIVLHVAGSLTPNTRDLWLYVFDGSLGFQPSWAVGNLMLDSRLLTSSAVLTYLSLPFAMAVVCAWQTPVRAKQWSLRLIAALFLAGLAGSILYNVVPATGPIYAFAQDFPSKTLAYKDLSHVALREIAVPTGIPRNAIPSLHVGWVVLLFWNSRGLPKWFRAVLLLYLALTVTFTLGGGQHYLIDLVVALPFVMAVQAAVGPGIMQVSRRIKAAILGLALTMAWLVLLRHNLSWVFLSPVIPWTLITGTVAVTLWLEWWPRKVTAKAPPVVKEEYSSAHA